MSRLSLTVVLTLACAQAVFAQTPSVTEYRKWEVTAFGGGGFIGSSEFPTPISGNVLEAPRTVGIDYGTGYRVGARVMENLGSFWASGLEYSFANQPLRFTNLSPDIQSLSLSHSLHQISYNVQLLATPRMSRFRPYAEVGAGTALFYIHERSKDRALELGLELRDSWKFAFNWGGGLKYLVRDQFAVAFDVKDYVSGIPSYGLPASARIVDGQYQPGISRTGFLHNWQFNFGLTYQWDDD